MKRLTGTVILQSAIRDFSGLIASPSEYSNMQNTHVLIIS
jgi:hypothetical protein